MNTVFEYIASAFSYIYELVHLGKIVNGIRSSYFYLEEQVLELRERISEIRLDQYEMKSEISSLKKRVTELEEQVNSMSKLHKSSKRSI